MPPTDKITIRLRWRDTDQLGHVYHASLVSLLDEARSRWIEQIGVDAMNFVVARLEISYKQEIVVDDIEIHVEVQAKHVGTASLVTREIVRTADRGICAVCECTLVRWDATTRSSAPMTNGEREAMRGATSANTGEDNH
ncbi:acyl-CoA thioesterase [Nocardia xishanensis]